LTEENVFFFPVGDFCRRDLITCSGDTTVVDLAVIMQKKNVSSIIVREEETPVGIITDRDLRNKVVSRGATRPDSSILKRPEFSQSPKGSRFFVWNGVGSAAVLGIRSSG